MTEVIPGINPGVDKTQKVTPHKHYSKLLQPDLNESTSISSIAISDRIGLLQLTPEIDKKPLPHSTKRRVVKAGSVSTSTRQITSYTTINGIYTDTGVRGHQYPEFAVKELIENAYDFLQEFYPVEYGNSKETRKISIHVKIEPIKSVNTTTTTTPSNQFAPPKVITHLIRIAVRNSNVDNKLVFEDLNAIFDYDSWYSSKRDQFRITTGALGDYLKRSLGMAYALWTSDFNPDNSLDERQWDEPVIFRSNGRERKVYINVESGKNVTPYFAEDAECDIGDFTEVEVSMPIATEWGSLHGELIDKLRNYCRKTRISKIKTEISFTVEGEAKQ
jgi:hypothetical protein